VALCPAHSSVSLRPTALCVPAPPPSSGLPLPCGPSPPAGPRAATTAEEPIPPRVPPSPAAIREQFSSTQGHRRAGPSLPFLPSGFTSRCATSPRYLSRVGCRRPDCRSTAHSRFPPSPPPPPSPLSVRERDPLQSRATAVTWGQPQSGPARSDPLQRAVTAEELVFGATPTWARFSSIQPPPHTLPWSTQLQGTTSATVSRRSAAVNPKHRRAAAPFCLHVDPTLG
jgi:hypothetical protein